MTDKYADLRDRLAALKLGGPVSTDARAWEAATDALDVELVAELLAERDAMRADAQRYRLLRRGQHWSVVDGVGDMLRADELDARIDAALKGAAHE